MYTLKLISEHIEQDTDFLIEAKEDGSKSYKIKGIFMQADVKNRNGRIYPMEVLKEDIIKNISTRNVHLENLVTLMAQQ
jgi:hypothetical protein